MAYSANTRLYKSQIVLENKHLLSLFDQRKTMFPVQMPRLYLTLIKRHLGSLFFLPCIKKKLIFNNVIQCAQVFKYISRGFSLSFSMRMGGNVVLDTQYIKRIFVRKMWFWTPNIYQEGFRGVFQCGWMKMWCWTFNIYIKRVFVNFSMRMDENVVLDTQYIKSS